MTRAARLLSALDGALVASHLINDGDLFGARGEQYVPTLNLIDGMVKDEGKEGEEGMGEHLTGEEMAALCNARRVLLRDKYLDMLRASIGTFDKRRQDIRAGVVFQSAGGRKRITRHYRAFSKTLTGCRRPKRTRSQGNHF